MAWNVPTPSRLTLNRIMTADLFTGEAPCGAFGWGTSPRRSAFGTGEGTPVPPLAMAQHATSVILNRCARFLPGEDHFRLFTYWRENLPALV